MNVAKLTQDAVLRIRKLSGAVLAWAIHGQTDGLAPRAGDLYCFISQAR
jgi:hypothetical protein